MNQPSKSSINWEALLIYERNTNAMVVRMTCDSIRRNIDDRKRVLELLTHLENTFPRFTADGKLEK